MKSFPSVEQLIELAEKNPEALEQMRRFQVQSLIDSAPEHTQKRLRGLQFQIDCQRQLHKNSPMGSCVAITRMMIASLQSLNEALQGEAPCRSQTEEANGNAAVIPFPVAAS